MEFYMEEVTGPLNVWICYLEYETISICNQTQVTGAFGAFCVEFFNNIFLSFFQIKYFGWNK